METLIVIAAAGLVAGSLNAVAGGGTFVSFPVLVWIGLPPITANATATLTALPGYLGSAWAFRRDIAPEGALGLRIMLVLSTLGGIIGAVLLALTPEDVFVGVVPWLLMAATALFALGPRLQAIVTGGSGQGTSPAIALMIGVSIYGGYFNGGLGIVLLAALSLLGYANLHGMNGLKNVLSAILSLAAALTCAATGLIAWNEAAVLAAATAVGGYLGGRYARRIRNTGMLRAAIVGVGAAMTLAFFAQ